MRDFVKILSDRIESDPELTVAGLALKAGLDNSTIRQMIKHHRSPRIDTALKICRALGTTVEDFMREGEDPAVQELHFLLSQLSNQEIRFLLSAAKGLRAQDQG